MIDVKDLVKAYGDRRALDGLDLHVDDGEIMAVLGPNGAGKTTLVEILAGFRRATSGHVEPAVRTRSPEGPHRRHAPDGERRADPHRSRGHRPVPEPLLLGAVTMSALGLAVAQAIPRGDAAATLLSTTMLPVVLISGVFFPVDELPGWIGELSKASPLTHIGALLAGSADLTHVAWLLGWTAAGLTVARWRFRFEPAPRRLRPSRA